MNLKSLKLNKKAISSLSLLGGRAPESHTCGMSDPVGADEPSHVWFTDAKEHTCETFAGTGCL